MDGFLKQSTAATILLGQFVDKLDAVTPKTALTLDVQISKNGGSSSDRNSASAISHDASGYYLVPLDVTDTNTLGITTVFAVDATSYLTVSRTYQIITAASYDLLFGGGLDSRIPTALISGRMSSIVGAYGSGLTPLQPTTAGRTLDVTATGAAGIDWGNLENPSTSNNLSATSVAAVGSVSTNGITGASLDATSIQKIFDFITEGGISFVQMFRVLHAVITRNTTGGGTSTLAFRDMANTKNRLVATVDANNNRTITSYDGA